MIELATKHDRFDINRLARQVHEMHVQWRPDLFTMPEELFPEEYYSELLKSRELYVAKLNGTVAGFCRLKMRKSADIGRVPRKIMEVHQLCVDEALRNHGIGTQMMEEVRVLALEFLRSGFLRARSRIFRSRLFVCFSVLPFVSS